MKKGILLCFSLFICMVLFLLVSNANAATHRSFITFGDWDITPDELSHLYGPPADHQDVVMIITNHGDQKLTNLRFRFYDASGINVTRDGDFYLFMSELPAHATTNLIGVTQLVRDHSSNRYCSIEIAWESKSDIKPEISMIYAIKDSNGNFLQLGTGDVLVY